jgi:hypothetical protein
MAQEAVFLRLQLGQALAQPVQPLAQALQVFGAADADRAREIGAPLAGGCRIGLGNRLRDQARRASAAPAPVRWK